MRLLLISLGVTCLVCVILFLYFRNRIGKMEQKLDLMFQLSRISKNMNRIQNKTPIQFHQTSDPVSPFPDAQMGGTETPSRSKFN